MRARILVIDDEEALCEILKFNLEKEGYEVDCAYSAEEALDMDLSVKGKGRHTRWICRYIRFSL